MGLLSDSHQEVITKEVQVIILISCLILGIIILLIPRETPPVVLSSDSGPLEVFMENVIGNFSIVRIIMCPDNHCLLCSQILSSHLWEDTYISDCNWADRRVEMHSIGFCY